MTIGFPLPASYAGLQPVKVKDEHHYTLCSLMEALYLL